MTKLRCAPSISSLDGLTLPPLRAQYMVQYKNSLIASILKHAAGCNISPSWWNVWHTTLWSMEATGEVGAYLWYDEIKTWMHIGKPVLLLRITCISGCTRHTVFVSLEICCLLSKQHLVVLTVEDTEPPWPGRHRILVNNFSILGNIWSASNHWQIQIARAGAHKGWYSTPWPSNLYSTEISNAGMPSSFM